MHCGVGAMKIVHVISGLGTGGAEANLLRLATALGRRGWAQHVVGVGAPSDHAVALSDVGVAVTVLGVGSASSALRGLMRLAGIVRSFRPDVLQGWMYHGDLFATLAHLLSPGAGRRKLFWNLRASNTRECGYARIVRLCALLSGRPDAVIANSQAGAEYHLAHGYRPRRIEIIPNGIDTNAFRPDPQACARIRGELGIAADAVVAIHAARFDPMKDHALFLAAMAELPAMQAIMTGKDTQTLTVPPNVHRLGIRRDMPALYAAADVVVSTSAYAEGFSNVVAEGMSAGLVPVATDVGDARTIIGETGTIVPVRDPVALVAALADIAAWPRDRLTVRGFAARTRIVGQFDEERAIERYVELYTA